MKFKLITLALLASLSAGAQAGDFEKVLGGVVLGVVLSNQVSASDRYYGPPSQVIYPQPVYAPPQVVYAPPPVIYAPPQVVYAPQPVYSYEYRDYREHRHGRHEWHRNWRD